MMFSKELLALSAPQQAFVGVFGGEGKRIFDISTPEVTQINEAIEQSKEDAKLTKELLQTGGKDFEKHKEAIKKASEKRGVPQSVLVQLFIREGSKGDTKIVNSIGATGLGQMIPGTWIEMIKGEQGYRADASKATAEQQADMAAKYLVQKKSGGDWSYALVNYHTGGSVKNLQTYMNSNPAVASLMREKTPQGYEDAASVYYTQDILRVAKKDRSVLKVLGLSPTLLASAQIPSATPSTTMTDIGTGISVDTYQSRIEAALQLESFEQRKEAVGSIKAEGQKLSKSFKDTLNNNTDFASADFQKEMGTTPHMINGSAQINFPILVPVPLEVTIKKPEFTLPGGIDKYKTVTEIDSKEVAKKILAGFILGQNHGKFETLIIGRIDALKQIPLITPKELFAQLQKDLEPNLENEFFKLREAQVKNTFKQFNVVQVKQGNENSVKTLVYKEEAIRPQDAKTRAVVEKLNKPNVTLNRDELALLLVHLKSQFDIDPKEIINQKGYITIPPASDKKRFQQVALAQSLLDNIGKSSFTDEVLRWETVMGAGYKESMSTTEHINRLNEVLNMQEFMGEVGRILALAHLNGEKLSMEQIQKELRDLVREWNDPLMKKQFEEYLKQRGEIEKTFNKVKNNAFLTTESFTGLDCKRLNDLVQPADELIADLEKNSNPNKGKTLELLKKRKQHLTESIDARAKLEKNSAILDAFKIKGNLTLEEQQIKLGIESAKLDQKTLSGKIPGLIEEWWEGRQLENIHSAQDLHEQVFALLTQSAAFIRAKRDVLKKDGKEFNKDNTASQTQGDAMSSQYNSSFHDYDVYQGQDASLRRILAQQLKTFTDKNAPQGVATHNEHDFDNILQAMIEKQDAQMDINQANCKLQTTKLSAIEVSDILSKDKLPNGFDLTKMRQFESLSKIQKESKTNEAFQFILSAAPSDSPLLEKAINQKKDGALTASLDGSANKQAAANEFIKAQNSGGVAEWWDQMSGGMKMGLMALLAISAFKHPEGFVKGGLATFAAMAVTKAKNPGELVDKIMNTTSGGIDKVGAALGLTKMSRWQEIHPNLRPTDKENAALVLIDDLEMEDIVNTLDAHNASFERLHNGTFHPEAMNSLYKKAMEKGNFTNTLGLTPSDLSQALAKMLMIRGARQGDLSASKGGTSTIHEGFGLMKEDLKNYKNGKEGRPSIMLKEWINSTITRYEGLDNASLYMTALKEYGFDKTSAFGRWAQENYEDGKATITKYAGKTKEMAWKGLRVEDPKNPGEYTWFFKVDGGTNSSLFNDISVKVDAFGKTQIYKGGKRAVNYTVTQPLSEIFLYTGIATEKAWMSRNMLNARQDGKEIFDGDKNKKLAFANYQRALNEVLKPLGQKIENADEDFSNLGFLGEVYDNATTGNAGAFEDNRATQLFRGIKQKLLFKEFDKLNTSPGAITKVPTVEEQKDAIIQQLNSDEYTTVTKKLLGLWTTKITDGERVEDDLKVINWNDANLVTLLNNNGWRSWFNNVDADTNKKVMEELVQIGVDSNLRDIVKAFHTQLADRFQKEYNLWGPDKSMGGERIYAQTILLFSEFMHTAAKASSDEQKAYARYLTEEKILPFFEKSGFGNTPTSWHIHELRAGADNVRLKTFAEFTGGKDVKLSAPNKPLPTIPTITAFDSSKAKNGENIDLQNLTTNLQTSLDSLDSFKTNVDAVKNEVEKQKDTVSNSQPNNIQEELKSFGTKLDTLNGNKKTFDTAIQNLETEIGKIKINGKDPNKDKAQQEINTANKKITELKEWSNDLQKEITAFETFQEKIKNALPSVLKSILGSKPKDALTALEKLDQTQRDSISKKVVALLSPQTLDILMQNDEGIKLLISLVTAKTQKEITENNNVININFGNNEDLKERWGNNARKMNSVLKEAFSQELYVSNGNYSIQKLSS